MRRRRYENVTVTLKPSRREEIHQITERLGFISQISCKLGGKEIVTEKFDKRKLERLLEMHSFKQPFRQRTRAAHSAKIYSLDLKVLSVIKDVGHHNGLDKAIGTIFLIAIFKRSTF